MGLIPFISLPSIPFLTVVCLHTEDRLEATSPDGFVKVVMARASSMVCNSDGGRLDLFRTRSNLDGSRVTVESGAI